MNPTFRRLIPAALAAAASFAVAVTGANAAVYDMRGYDETQNLALPQVAGSLWTAHYGDASGTLLPVLPGFGYGYSCVICTLLGPLINAGDSTFGIGAATPTFDGLFLHPGFSAADSTSIVFQAQVDTWLDGVTVTTELVGNGLVGNGLDVLVTLTRGGVASTLDAFIVSGSNQLVNPFSFGATALLFAAGDKIEVDVGSNGSYFHDHLNINVVTTAAAAATQVPEPSTYALVLAAGAALMWRRRSAQDTTRADS